MSIAAITDQARPWVVVGITSIAASLVLLPFAWAGLASARRVGISPIPWLDSAIRRRNELPPRPLLGVGVAALTAVGTVVLSFPLATLLLPPVDPDAHPFAGLEPLEGLTAALLAGAEEVVFRVGVLFAFLALLGVRASDRSAPLPRRAWVAIVASALLFGLVHAPDGAVLGASLVSYLPFALVQKGLLAGIPLAYIAWRWGVEMAFCAHFAANAIILALVELGLG